MNLITLSWSYIRTQRLNTFLNLLLLALGVATIVILLLFTKQLGDRLARDGRGIDLVIGAKGSPIQLILSTVYHMDVPTGNIPLPDAERVMHNPAVKQAIPLALGDSYHGFRIVGTTHDYVEHYGGVLAQGRLWDKPMQAVIGAAAAKETGLRRGATFVGTHGIATLGEVHRDSPYDVVGVLAPTGTVLDRLILCSVESVWLVHEREYHHHHEEEGTAAGGHEASQAPAADEHEEPDHKREVTALLLQYRSPIAAATLPRFINSQSALQAASPAFETARLLTLLGVGIDTLHGFGFLLIFTATLGVFIALYHALAERRYDLAIMRTLGASKATLLWHILLEGLLLAFAGTLLGIALGHGVAEALGVWLRHSEQLQLSGLVWVPAESWLLALACIVGLVAAILPAVQAYRVDIARTLASG